MVLIDATDMILGRMAAFAAKQSLLGKEVIIINSEKAVISGRREDILARYKNKMSRGIPSKGPFFPRLPERFVKRIVRGMLPYKQEKGKSALKRVICHRGVPISIKDSKPIELPKNTKVDKLPNYSYLTVQEICKVLGGKR